MCCCGSRCATIFAGIFCLATSGAWAIIAFLGLSLYNCDIELEYQEESPEVNPLYYLYFVYFLNRDCTEIPRSLNFEEIGSSQYTPPPGIDYTLPPGITTPFPIPRWPDKFGTVEVTYNIMIAYAVLNMLWLVTSLIMIVASVVRINNGLAYYPWILMAAGNIILDVVATVIFGLHASESQDAIGLFKVIGVLNLSDDLSQYDGFYIMGNVDYLTMIPSLVMAAITSRLVIGWLIHIILLICVSVAVSNIVKQGKRDPNLLPYPHHNNNMKNNTSPVNNQERNMNYHEQNNPSYVNDNQPHPNYLNLQPEYDQDGYLKGDRPFSYTNGVPQSMSLPPRYPSQDTIRHDKGIPRPGIYSSSSQSTYQSYDEPASPWFNPSAPPDNRDEPQSLPAVLRKRLEMPSDPDVDRIKKKRAPDVPPRQDLNRMPPKPTGISLHPRPTSYEEVKPLRQQPSQTMQDQVQDPQRQPGSNYEEVKPPSRQPSQTKQDQLQEPNRNAGISGPRNSGSVPPEELRSQLPWSYFDPRNVAMKPKQPAVIEENEERPPVPVPDYTLHFGKSKRPSTSGWSSEDGVSRSSTSSSYIGGHRQP